MTSSPYTSWATAGFWPNTRRSGRFFVGVDLGQSFDPTAIIIVEREQYFARTIDRNGAARSRTLGQATFNVVHAERLPLNTAYPEVVRYVQRLLQRPPLVDNFDLVLDFTGVGRPVFDMFIHAGMSPVGVSITTGGDEVIEGQVARVAKGLLVSRLTALLHERRLKIARTLIEAESLMLELQNFRAKVTETGYWKFGARSGAHDDLVLALAIAVWRACTSVGNTGLLEYLREEAAGSGS